MKRPFWKATMFSLLTFLILPVMSVSGESEAVQPSHPATFANPVYPRDFPDPFIMQYGDRFYAYATEGNGYRFQALESTDLVHWTERGTVFTVPWSNAHFWAPEVFYYRHRFYMTYSALNPQTHRHDIGIAKADNPLGPFKHEAILVKGDDNRVGVIDATIFFDKGHQPYLIYSEEEPRRIVMQKLRSDLLATEGPLTEIVRPDRPWERNVTEAPTLLRRGGKYHLFFSVGWFQSNKADASYAVCHATAKSVEGPYVKDPEPLLQTIPGKVYGPGHQCLIDLPSGETWMGYHAWDNRGEPRYGANPAGRTLRLDRLTWKGDRPVMSGPTVDFQQSPVVEK